MFDLVIIGGGITGAALAYSAVHARCGTRPLRVALVERRSLGSGTSSRSSGLLHGGLRYLAQGRLSLVRRLLRGRQAFSRLAPHLVQRAPFLLPVAPAVRSAPTAARSPHPAWLTELALHLYELCDDLRGPGLWLGGLPLATPTRLDASVAAQREPLLGEAAAGGAFAYDEVSVEGARLVEELAAGAARAGALVLTGTRCERLELRDGQVRGVWLRSQSEAAARTLGARSCLEARVVVDATGPWSGQLERLLGSADGHIRAPSMQLSRGTHLVLPTARLPLANTVVFYGADGRALFASPRAEGILVGTTEQAHRGSPDEVSATTAEVLYLLSAVAAAFPHAGLRASDIKRTFAGVRPLAGAGGHLGRLDRGYALDWPLPGLLAMRGGKLTLALAAARQALRSIDQRRDLLGLEAMAPRPEHLLPPLVHDRLDQLRPASFPLATPASPPLSLPGSAIPSRRAA